MIDVKETEENTFQITWDENDPAESMLNTWTEEDFIRVIRECLEKIVNVQHTRERNSKNENQTELV